MTRLPSSISAMRIKTDIKIIPILDRFCVRGKKRWHIAANKSEIIPHAIAAKKKTEFISVFFLNQKYKIITGKTALKINKIKISVLFIFSFLPSPRVYV